jgi:FkbH-like protein/FkbM family methyltransferase
MYEEIFINRAYLKHGITLKQDDCVFDVGANIGLFSLFASRQCKDGRVYAFEPSVSAFQALEINSSLYGANIKTFNFGLSNKHEEASFTFYRNSSVFSGFHADVERDRSALKAIIQNILTRHSSPDTGPLDLFADDLLANRLESETCLCQLRRLSDIIIEEKIERIDLLKIDAEGSELDILEGIDEQHWDIVKQIVIEMHDRDGGRRRRLSQVLDEKGFQVAVDQEESLSGSGLYNIYAVRLSGTGQASLSLPCASASDKLVEQNITELVKSLKSPQRRYDIAHLIVVCPVPPALVWDVRTNAFLCQMEQRLAGEIAGLSNIHLISSSELLNTYPVSRYYDPHADELGRVPYTPEFFAAMGSLIARRYHALKHTPYKAIVLDCDNTLWRGVCGEDGPWDVEVDPPRRWLQEFIVKQHDAGMLICLCSKNNEEDVFEVFKCKPEMPLKRNNILAWRINWGSKSSNIRALAEDLNIGLDSIIFLDDDPAECAEVRVSCPEVLVLQLPAQAADLPEYFNNIWAFDKQNLTGEDKRRTGLYKQEIRREASRHDFPTLALFLESLQLKVRFFEAARDDFARIAQLTQRTNQFNLTTIRRSEGEIQELIETRKLECIAVHASDRFGDYGLVGAMLFSARSTAITVDTFLLSCRALGKGIEHRMLARLGEIALERGHADISITFFPSGRNELALGFLNSINQEFIQQAAKVSAVPVAVESQQRFASDRVFRFPASFAAQLTYSAKIAEFVVSPATSAGPASALSLQGRSQNADPSFLYHHIADELHEAHAILKAIESQRIPSKHRASRAIQAPNNEIERTIAGVWQRVLGIERVGIDENFFEIGGTSLTAVQVIAHLNRIFGAAIPLVSLFDKTTISNMARLLQRGEGEDERETRISSVRERGKRRRAKNLAQARRSSRVAEMRRRVGDEQ